MNVISLRSGKEIGTSSKKAKEVEEEKELEVPVQVEVPMQASTSRENPPQAKEPEMAIQVKAPFPNRLRKKTETDHDVLTILKKVEVNIPLIKASKEVPRLAKYLKELCTNKRKI